MYIAKAGSEPAFPNASDLHGHCCGISVRDYFAAKAMQGLLADHDENHDEWSWDEFASRSYQMADAIIKVRAMSQE